jgi:glycosyltransferase involved in cell wall biosynthesis
MDFCENNEGVIFIKNDGYEQGDKRFFAEGNMLAKPSFEGLKQALRWAFEHRKELQEMGKKGSEFVKDFTWENSAKKIIKFLEEKNGL